MKTFFKVGIGIFLFVALGGGAYLSFALPRSQPAADINTSYTPEMIERGRYLATNVVICLDCHSDRDWTIYGGPAMEPLGAGRKECITQDSGKSGISVSEWTFPGLICIRNITPDPETGIGNWTDGEIIRAFREGIGRDGRPLFPIMPYFILRNISDPDAKAIVAFLRTLPAVKRAHPPAQVDFPMNLFMKIFPAPVTTPVPAVDLDDPIANGKYLTKIARCEFCHTPRRVQGRIPIEGEEFAGGVPFNLNGGETMISNNLTSHEDGLAAWSKEDFIARMQLDAEPRPVDPSQNTVSSWHAYSGMATSDLSDIYDYLQTVTPKKLGKM